jgi:hypothetical protein
METRFNCQKYIELKNIFINNHNLIITQEQLIFNSLFTLLNDNSQDIKKDFNAAILLSAYWINYAPRQRGNQPSGESFPWAEVGEKTLQGIIYSLIAKNLPNISFPGLPFGHDIRFQSDNNLIQIDVKSTGPNDRLDEIVASPNQVTGDGFILNEFGVKNSKIIVTGKTSSMNFEPELVPFYVLGGIPILNLTFYVKCVYSVHSLGNQPIKYLELICVPNGLMLFNDKSNFSNLFTPGKDEKNKEAKRVRIKLNKLAEFDSWRCKKIIF